jgi:serine/threonine protein kinase
MLSMQYQLGDCVGKGATASVYCALDTSTGRTIAIKKFDRVNMSEIELNGNPNFTQI